jgi:hypothetical protein
LHQLFNARLQLVRLFYKFDLRIPVAVDSLPIPVARPGSR